MVAKKFMAALVVLMLAVSAFAQDGKRVFFGLRLGGGIGMSALKNDDFKDYLDESDDLKFRSGGGSFDIAPFVSIQLADAFAIGTELMFTRFGYGGLEVTKDETYEDEWGSWSQKKGDYWTTSRAAMVIPVLAQVTLLDRKLNIFAGPHFTINMGNFRDNWREDGERDSEKWDSDETKDFADELKVPPIGLTVGANFGFNVGAGRLFFDVRYITDLGRVKEENAWLDWDEDTFEDIYGERDLIRRAKLAFSIGYEFGAGRR